MLIANPLGQISDTIYVMSVQHWDIPYARLAKLYYSLQIYYDFFEYSDMVIGFGKMMFFTFLENFNYPYISRSIREFWRQWHMSLFS